jgi:hypothetical protein
MDKETFDTVISRFEKIYSPIVSESGHTLIVEREWESEEVNAYAHQEDSNYFINIMGGLARHPEATTDALATVLCHEMGHHIAGAPNVYEWISNEGQSDYFATTKCIRKYFQEDDNIKIVSEMVIPESVSTACDASHLEESEKAICKRSAMAGLSLARLLNSLRSNSPEVSFDTPDLSVVKRTYNKHPAPQCRLDTYFAGAVCEISDTVNPIIQDERAGYCNAETHSTGLRPACWYKAKPISEFQSRL